MEYESKQGTQTPKILIYWLYTSKQYHILYLDGFKSYITEVVVFQDEGTALNVDGFPWTFRNLML